MSDNPQDCIPSAPEVDQHGGDDLPTYEDLAAQNGPNSRFGRWKGWIEKRAAERYADVTEEDLARRRQRGWGDSVHDHEPEPQYAESSIASTGALEAPPQVPHPHLHIQTELSTPASVDFPSDVDDPIPSRGEVLSPSHLALHQFGSRFLPHTTSPIRCLLPILNDTLLLVGHDDGLSVLDMFPKEWTDRGLIEHGPNEAQVHHIWVGEGVHQLSLLESESTGEGTPQGVVLALVGGEGDSPKEQESPRAIRMYNLASLVNLAKWGVAQGPGVLPIRMDGLGTGKCATNGKSHHHKSIPALAKGLKNIKLDSPIIHSPYTRDLHGSTSSFGAVPGSQPFKPEPQRADSSASAMTIDSSWDVVEDLPVRWAMDYVPLAPPGTRLCGTSVVSYDLWAEPSERRRGAAYLAVIIKSNILLYHAPKGERAFRFVKDFYTPISARSVVFVQQSVQDMTRSPSDVGPRSSRGLPGHHHHHSRHMKGMSVGGTPFYPSQLSMFVIFEKKAGLIRIADSAVGEVELHDDPLSSLQNLLSPSMSSGSSLGRRSRSSWDGGKGFVKDSKAPWIAPTKISIPSVANRSTFSQNMYILTRGKISHILPHPLPANLSSTPPYRIIHWTTPPMHVQTRTCRPQGDTPPYLQIIAFGEYGIEVQEMDLSSISQKQKKGKGRVDELRCAQADIGGDTGFLVTGGHWDKQLYSDYSPTTICETLDSISISELSTEELVDVLHSYEGMYGWVRKGHGDWRVFWLGGGNVCENEQ
ncbi:hypothetical protein BDY19DRAFT_924063 [Irpex rosettiformis]|uniref:Uncharacterized protein n=1 Tax=Irpex rosettiformis TaxID=378272 RepID=A0ACB8UDK9_9APHY|nr:hypothetical protein BDY19DRAFT_924063 [Irpex rosettiformis]